MTKIYPRTGNKQTVYLNTIIQDPQIVGLAYIMNGDLDELLSIEDDIFFLSLF